MSEKPRALFAQYGAAILFTALAVGLRWLLNPWLGDRPGLATLYAAVALSVWIGGYGPALLTAAGGYLACAALFVASREALTLNTPRGVIGFLFFVLSCGIIIAFGEGMRRNTTLSRELLEREIARRREAENQAEGAQHHAASILASITDACYTLDREWRFTYLNPRAEQYYGLPAGQMLGRVIWEQLPELTATVVKERYESAVRRRAPEHFEVLSPVTDRWVEVHAYPGEEGLSVFFRDITERKEMEQELHRERELLRTIIDAIPAMITVYEPDTRLLRLNPEFERVTGWAAHEGTGVSLMEECYPDPAYREEVSRFMQSCREGWMDIRMRTRDGRDVETSWANIRLSDGTQVGIGIDITDRKRAETALRESEERFRAFMDHTPARVTLKDRQGRYVYANRAAEEGVGAAPGALVGKTRWDVLPPDAAAQLAENERQVRENNTALQFTEATERPDGRHVFLSVRFPVGDANGEVLIGGVTLDVTEQKRAEEQARRLAGIIEATPDFVAIAGTDGVLEYLNAAGREMLGVAPDADLRSLTHEELCPAWVYERTQREWMPLALRDGAVSGEGALLTHDGREIPVSFVMIVQRDDGGDPRAISVIARDMSERKRIEEALRDADRRKDEFLATLAHELRNPLAPIRNAVQVLKAGERPERDLSWSRDVIDRQVQQMARLLEDLLDVSRISRNKLELRRERVELADVVETALETSRPLIEAGRHECRTALPDSPVYLNADPVRLAQVFSNLLNNAAKYTEPGGRIELTAEREDGHVVVTVKDSGIGLTPEVLPRLFEIFSQAKPALELAQGGLGIGLSLVKGLVELHGGSVEARSDGPGKGSEFIVRLPVAAEAPAEQMPGEDAAALRGGRRRILVADDNRDGADSMAMLLETTGSEVVTAYDGEQAVELARAWRPDVALLDIGMPKLSGYEACRRIREQPWGARMVLIAVTGWGQDEDRQRTREAGFDHHLVKPVDHAALLRLLEEPHPAAK